MGKLAVFLGDGKGHGHAPVQNLLSQFVCLIYFGAFLGLVSAVRVGEVNLVNWQGYYAGKKKE